MTEEKRQIHVEDHQDLFDATIAEMRRASEMFIPSILKRVRRRAGITQFTDEQLALVHAVIKGFNTANKKKGENTNERE